MSSWMIWQTMRDHKCVKISKISHLNLFCRSQVIAELQSAISNKLRIAKVAICLSLTLVHAATSIVWKVARLPCIPSWCWVGNVGKLQLRQRLGELGNTLALARLSKPEYINSTWLYENMLPNPQLLVHNGSKGTCCNIIWTGWPFHVSRCQKGCRRHSAVTSKACYQSCSAQRFPVGLGNAERAI